MHAPFGGLLPSCSDYKIRDVIYERFSQTYIIAKTLDVSNIVFHTGSTLGSKPDCDKIKRFGEFWNYFLKDKDEDIEIHLENVFERHWEYLKEYIDVIDSNKVSICLDLGHVNVNSDQDIKTWVKGFKEKIKYVHIHNNYGDVDSHNGLKRGTIDMYKALSLLKEYSPDAIWTLETSEIQESIDWLLDHRFCEISSLKK